MPEPTGWVAMSRHASVAGPDTREETTYFYQDGASDALEVE